MRSLRAIGKNVAVVFDPKPDAEGLIAIPDQWKQLPWTATVHSVGGRVLEAIKAGDRVVVKRYMDAQAYRLDDGRTVHVMDEEHVMGVYARGSNA